MTGQIEPASGPAGPRQPAGRSRHQAGNTTKGTCRAMVAALVLGVGLGASGGAALAQGTLWDSPAPAGSGGWETGTAPTPTPTPTPTPAPPGGPADHGPSAGVGGQVGTGGGEMLVFSLPPGWQPIHTAEAQSVRRAVFVPKDQSAETWSDMVVVTMARGHDVRDVRAAFAQTKDAYARTCQAHTSGTPQTSVEDNIGRAFWTLGCHRRKDVDGGEVAFFFYIQGRQGAYLMQRIWRVPSFGAQGPSVPTEEREEAVTFFRSARLCLADSGDPACPAAPPAR